jgi:hypothetical protein
MTKLQRIEHKIGNQKRKAAILQLAKHGPEKERHWWASMRVGQNGTFSFRRAK